MTIQIDHINGIFTIVTDFSLPNQEKEKRGWKLEWDDLKDEHHRVKGHVFGPKTLAGQFQRVFANLTVHLKGIAEDFILSKRNGFLCIGGALLRGVSEEELSDLIQRAIHEGL